MAANSTVPVHDLRSASVDVRRDRDSKHKWALGVKVSRSQAEVVGNFKPWRPSQRADVMDRRSVEKERHKVHLARKQPVVRDNFHSDSSAEEDVEEASAAPEPDAGITYSFDAARGPSQGSNVLPDALAQAVERFENKVTDKLVKDEYDVLDYTELHDSTKQRSSRELTRAPPDDDYEFV